MMNHTGISLTHTHTHTPVACRVVGTRGQGQFGRPHHMWRKVTESQFLRPPVECARARSMIFKGFMAKKCWQAKKVAAPSGVRQGHRPTLHATDTHTVTYWNHQEATWISSHFGEFLRKFMKQRTAFGVKHPAYQPNSSFLKFHSNESWRFHRITSQIFNILIENHRKFTKICQSLQVIFG